MTEMAEIAARPSGPPDARVLIRPLRQDDVQFAAALHADALAHGFFARLGRGFLRHYYASFVASPHSVALCAEADGRRAGVLVGTVANAPHYRWVVRNCGVEMALSGLASLITHPRELAFFVRTRVARYLRAWRRLRRAGRGAAPEPTRRVAVLTHVAVDAAVRGAGAGAALVEAFVAAARAAGCDEACLVTLSGDDGAGRFYKRLGWIHLEDRCDADGRSISVFARLL